MQIERYDVIVIGGGTAGVVAAIQAGRAGAETLLVEKTGMMGGTITAAGVNFPGLFHAWGRQIVAGIGWELVTRCVAETGASLPDFANYQRPHWQLQIRINPYIYAAICDEALVDAGVDILFHTMIADINENDDDSRRVSLCTKTGLTEKVGKVIIDATGDANAAALAGFPIDIPGETQPSTLFCRVGGYDFEDLDINAINRAFEFEVQKGRLAYTDVSWDTTGANATSWLRGNGGGASHINCINARDSHGKTQLELDSRKSLLRLYRFLRQQPGLQNLVVEYTSPECGVREAAVIQGKCKITADDYRSGRVWDDAVCNSFYPIDLHTSTGGGLRKTSLAEGVVPTVPRGALLPAGSDNFLVVGRCISSDRLANSALRTQATCMATGQSAGAMAALSAAKGIDPEELSIVDVHALLRKHGAIVPEINLKRRDVNHRN
jgi:hypothetical protein